MKGISIYCKSFRRDLSRAAELAESVRRFNNDSLPFYISVPENDLALFKDRIGTGDIEWLRDEDIIGSNRNISYDDYASLPGQISQQVVKAEFWRVNPLPICLCVDSDSIFIKEFSKSDFLATDTIPYTVMHEDKSFSAFCLANGLESYIETFEVLKSKFRDTFGRQGPSYNFLPFPVTWHRGVWEDLEKNILTPGGMTIIDALKRLSSEALWYGETLLKYHAVDIMPREPFFKAYLYLEEYEHDRKAGVTQEILSRLYYGVVYQSNWHPKRLGFIKNRAYYFKKKLKKFRMRFCL